MRAEIKFFNNISVCFPAFSELWFHTNYICAFAGIFYGADVQ